MTVYKGIKGFNVQSLTTDPVATGGAWSESADLPAARHNAGGVGTATDALHFGGLPTSALTFSFNGTAWTSGGSMASNDHAMASFGITTAAVSATGESGVSSTDTTEEYDGTSWGSGGNVSTARTQAAGFGTLTVGAIAGGFTGSPSIATEEYNGTSWTAGGDLTVGSYGGAAGGTQTAGIFALGQTAPGTTNSVHYYNGTAWTAQSGTANLARAGMNSTGAGTQTDFGIYGGGNPTTNSTEFWDGTSFSTASNLPSARSSMSVGKSGTSTSAIIFGGSAPPSIATTNIYSVGGIGDTIKNEGQVYYNTTTNLLKLTKTVYGTGAWASGGALNVAKRSGSLGADTNAAATYAGGTNPSGTLATTELYNGTSWTASPQTLNEVRSAQGTIGSSTSMLVVTGLNATAITVNVEEWDGSNWTEKANVNTGRYEGVGGSGTSTSGMIFGGQVPAQSALTEIYNGTGWTEVSPLNTARSRVGASTKGTITATLCFGGQPNRAITEEWNGSTWSEVADLNTGRQELGGAGISTDALAYAGYSGSDSALTESWNGTSWTEVADMATARRHGTTGSGSAQSAIQASGETTVVLANTEEWNVPATVTNLTVASS